ncbi:hypothetical protein EDC01DRAFT_636150 [Geopyxis carbonaria]|nr:hypothetical protein EDC01DRAFT_636150 [Geopyxis carbonaria]
MYSLPNVPIQELPQPPHPRQTMADHQSGSTDPPLTARQTRLRADTIREDYYTHGRQGGSSTPPPSCPLPTPVDKPDGIGSDNFAEFSEDSDTNSKSPPSSRSASSSEFWTESSVSPSVGRSRSTTPPPRPTPRLQLLLRAMDRVTCGTFEANLTKFEKAGFRVPFWVVLGRNSNRALGQARADLIKKITRQNVTISMVRRVELRWARVWEIAQGLEERKRFLETEEEKKTHGMLKGLGPESLEVKVRDLKEEQIH